jgi:hypothetical protein
VTKLKERERMSTVEDSLLYVPAPRDSILYCAETQSIGPEDVKKLVTAQMSCLRRICGDRSWEQDSTPSAKFGGSVKCLPSEILLVTTCSDG